MSQRFYHEIQKYSYRKKQHYVILKIFIAEILDFFHFCLSPAASRYAVGNSSEFFHIQGLGPSAGVYPRFFQHASDLLLGKPSDSRKGIVERLPSLSKTMFYAGKKDRLIRQLHRALLSQAESQHS